MKFQKLGNTDIDVSVVALGTWGLGGGSVWTDGDSTVEELLGKALKGRRNDFVLQTKCSLNWRNEGGNFHYERDGYTVNNDTRASAVKKDVEDSLRRMGTDYLDSVIVHYVCLHIRKPAETYLLYRNFSVFSLLSMAENILICVKSITRYFRPMVCWRKDF